MSILIIHHVESNNLGPLEEILQARKLAYRYMFCHQIEPRHVALDDVGGLIILGGPQSASEEERHAFMRPEMQMIRNAVSNDLPVFGICLGSQLLARSMGARVEKNKVNGQDTQEVGWTPIELSEAGQRDPVLQHLEHTAQFQWHEDTYHLPPGGVHLAHTALCAQQAFTLDRPGAKAYGVQFHPEVSKAVIQDWLQMSRSLEPAQKQLIWDETDLHFDTRHARSRRLFSAFCELAF